MKIDRTSYIDDLVQQKKDTLSLCALEPKRKFTEKKVTGLSWHKPKEDPDWRIKKQRGPDMGSYDPRESLKKVEKSVGNTVFSKSNIPNFSS